MTTPSYCPICPADEHGNRRELLLNDGKTCHGCGHRKSEPGDEFEDLRAEAAQEAIWNSIGNR